MRHGEIVRSELLQTVFPRRGLSRRGAAVALLLAFSFSVAASAQKPSQHKVWEAGAYSFSDELGGFLIRGATGAGTKDDPIVITEELESASPVTMVIRTIKPIRPFDYSGDFANGFVHVVINVTNNSELPWIEFEFELQEQLNVASSFGDGLSFDQRRSDGASISSTSFARFSRDFEPFDRLLFTTGKVDHLESASFGFLISDYTPRWEFYLVQDPRIPSS